MWLLKVQVQLLIKMDFENLDNFIFNKMDRVFFQRFLSFSVDKLCIEFKVKKYLEKTTYIFLLWNRMSLEYVNLFQ